MRDISASPHCWHSISEDRHPVALCLRVRGSESQDLKGYGVGVTADLALPDPEHLPAMILGELT
jgi:hypothetical protein